MPSGGWIRRQSMREIERRPAGERRIEITLRENFFSDPYRKAASSILFFGTREKRNRLEGSGHQRTLEGADRVGKGAEVVMDNGSRTAHGDPRPAFTPS